MFQGEETFIDECVRGERVGERVGTGTEVEMGD